MKKNSGVALKMNFFPGVAVTMNVFSGVAVSSGENECIFPG